MRTWIAFLAVAAAFWSGCGDDGSRTFYESLDLESPTAAVETFADAFARDDFMTVWLVLDTEAQLRIQQELNLLQYGNVLAPTGVDALMAWISTESFLESLEHGDQWYFFDQAMLLADGVDGFLIDLSEGVEIEEEVSSGEVATITGSVGDIAATVTFRLTRTDTGRWRVHQVAVPGGDPDLIPWSAPGAES